MCLDGTIADTSRWFLFRWRLHIEEVGGARRLSEQLVRPLKWRDTHARRRQAEFLRAPPSLSLELARPRLLSSRGAN